MSTIAHPGVVSVPRQRTSPDPYDRFMEFHRNNPDVYDLLVESARSYRRQTGNVSCGMSLLFGRVRWVLALRTDDGDFKINNNYAPFYSRMIMEREPDLRGMFTTRTSVADKGGLA